MAETRKKRYPKFPTPVGTAAYAWVSKPDTGHKFSDGKYKVTLVLTPEDDLTAIKEGAYKAFREEFPNVKIDDEDIKLGIMSGDDHKNEEFRGKVLLTAKTKNPPQQLDTKRRPLKKGVQVRSGDLVRLVANYYPYTKTEKVKEGKKLIDVQMYGVSFQLSLVQLVEKRGGSGGAELLDDIEGFQNEDWEDRDPTDTEDADEAADEAAQNADF